MQDAETLRAIFQDDQRQASTRERIAEAEDDADVVAAYYTRLKAAGICVAHVVALTEGYQQMQGWDE